MTLSKAIFRNSSTFMNRDKSLTFPDRLPIFPDISLHAACSPTSLLGWLNWEALGTPWPLVALQWHSWMCCGGDKASTRKYLPKFETHHTALTVAWLLFCYYYYYYFPAVSLYSDWWHRHNPNTWQYNYTLLMSDCSSFSSPAWHFIGYLQESCNFLYHHIW